MEIRRGRGPQRPKFLKESMTLNWNFKRHGWGRAGGGTQVKIPSMAVYWYMYFLKQHIDNNLFQHDVMSFESIIKLANVC